MGALCFQRRVLCLVALVTVATSPLLGESDAFSIATATRQHFATRRGGVPLTAAAATKDGSDDRAQPVAAAPAPTLNGKMVLPYKVIGPGLEGHKVAAVYAVLNSQYKRGSGDGWEHCEYVGVTRNLHEALQSHAEAHGVEAVANVRALSFSFPQQAAMEEVALQWRKQAEDAGGKGTNDAWARDFSAEAEERAALLDMMESAALMVDDDDDDDDDDDEWENDEEEIVGIPSKTSNDSSLGNPIVSPFESGAEASTTAGGGTLAFTLENVDKVLDEVRPYLIADAGNVAVESVDEVNKNVYLILQGACGSCASSTVTMQMGIERVLKESFPDLGEVIQVEDTTSASPKPTELTLEAVEAEVNRIKPAIIAMGGVVKIIKVDPIGVVELEFRGSNKVKQGLELAIRDVDFVKHVKFVME